MNVNAHRSVLSSLTKFIQNNFTNFFRSRRFREGASSRFRKGIRNLFSSLVAVGGSWKLAQHVFETTTLWGVLRRFETMLQLWDEVIQYFLFGRNIMFNQPININCVARWGVLCVMWGWETLSFKSFKLWALTNILKQTNKQTKLNSNVNFPDLTQSAHSPWLTSA